MTTAAATTFFVALGAAPLYELAALVLGGIIAAPFGGWAVRHISPRFLMAMVGVLVLLLAAWQLIRYFKLF